MGREVSARDKEGGEEADNDMKGAGDMDERSGVEGTMEGDDMGDGTRKCPEVELLVAELEELLRWLLWVWLWL
jgi:hypothetical protein